MPRFPQGKEGLTRERPKLLDAGLLEDVLEHAPVGVALLDDDLRFLRVNAALAQIDGIPAADHVGADGRSPVGASLIAQAARALESGLAVERVEISAGGAPLPRHFVVSCYPVGAEDGRRCVACLVREIADVRASRARLEGLQELTAELTGVATQAAVTDLVLQRGRALAGASEAAAALLSGDGEELVTIGMVGFGAEVERGWGRFPLGRHTPMGDAVASGEAVFIETAAERERLYPHLPNVSGHTIAAVPIRGHGRVFGALAFRFDDARPLPPADRRLMLTLGEHYGQALDRARLFEAAESERRRLLTLMHQLPVGVAIAEAPSGAVIAVNEKASQIWRLPAPDQLPIRDVSGYAAYHADGRRYSEDEWPLARSLATGEVVDGEEVEAEFADGTRGHVSISARPVLDDQGRLVGAVTTLVDVSERRRREVEARFLAEATELLAESLDPEETLRRLAALAVPRLADWCSVTVLEGRRLRTVAVAHVDPRKVEIAREFDRAYPPDLRDSGGVARVVQSGRAQLTPLITREMLEQGAPDERFTSIIADHLGLRSVIMVPLAARGRTFGAITLVAAESRRIFASRDLEFAEDFAARAALAVDNARLYREQAQIAEALQRSLLPVRLPEMPGLEVATRYRAAGRGNEVGGDFYDLWTIDERRFGVVVGDVCGKGATAAALTALARHTVRTASLMASDHAPRSVLEALNDAIIRRTDGDRFCTVVYARGSLREDGIELLLGSAGHPMPFVLRAGGGVEQLRGSGTLLGIYSDIELPERRLLLRPGDRLLLWTDGVSERRAGGRQFGEERLRSLLRTAAGEPADQLAHRIEQAVVDFGPGEPQDDIALVVLGAAALPVPARAPTLEQPLP